tara:strand:- start:522 stop:884 length:363 start_codon:yes stop_codon:yes gene_type:complete
MNYPDQNDIKPINESGDTGEQFQVTAEAYKEWLKLREINKPTKRKRGRPRKLPNDQLTPDQKYNRKRIKNMKNIHLTNEIKEDFEKCQRAESQVLGFELTSQQTIRLLLNIYFREQHIER